MPQHYNYQVIESDQIYSFVTDNGIEYKITFLPDENFSVATEEEIPDIFQFIIEKVSKEKALIDPRVGLTITHLVSTFFETKVKSLLFICDSLDNHSKARARKFNQWYSNCQKTDIIHKIDQSFIDGDSCYYTSYLIHKDNPNYNDLVKIYNLSAEAYRDIK